MIMVSMTASSPREVMPPSPHALRRNVLSLHTPSRGANLLLIKVGLEHLHVRLVLVADHLQTQRRAGRPEIETHQGVALHRDHQR